jgi:hypothetical protein
MRGKINLSLSPCDLNLSSQKNEADLIAGRPLVLRKKVND